MVGTHPNLKLMFLTSYSRTVLGHMVLVRKLNCSISEGTLTLSGSIEQISSSRSLSPSLHDMMISTWHCIIYPQMPHICFEHAHILCLLRERKCAHLNVSQSLSGCNSVIPFDSFEGTQGSLRIYWSIAVIRASSTGG